MTGPGRQAAESRDGAGGFLLTETLATFTISAFVLLGLVSASSVLLQAVDRAVAHVQNVDDLARTMNALRRDISGLMRARWNGEEPQGFVFRGGPNSLFFARAQREPDGSAEINVVALREIVAGNGTRFMRGEARLSGQARGFGDLQFGPQTELGTGPARLRFYYAAAPGAKAVSGDARSWTDIEHLPGAILVEAIDPDTKRVLVSTRVPIHADADIGCIAEQEGAGASASPEIAATSAPAAPVAYQPPGTAPVSPQPDAGGQAESAPRFCSREGAEKKKPARAADAEREHTVVTPETPTP